MAFGEVSINKITPDQATPLSIEGDITVGTTGVPGSVQVYGDFTVEGTATFNGDVVIPNVLPVMTRAHRDAIQNPEAGTMIFQGGTEIDEPRGLRVFNGTNWMRFTEVID